MAKKKKLCFLFQLVFLLSFILPASGAVKVSRAGLNGRAPRLLKHSWTFMECMVENPDPVKHLVEVRVQPSEDDGQTGFYSGTILIPPDTTAFFSFPVFVESAENYTVTVMSDGVKQPASVYNDIMRQMYDNKARTVALFNDADEESLGAFTQLDGIKGKVYQRSFNAATVPDNWQYLANEEALLFYKPDFSRYSRKQFQTILAYAANGGTLIFMTPDAVIAAAETPLADLLPVKPLGIRKVTSLPAFEKKFPAFRRPENWSTEFLLSTPKERCVSVLSHEGMPLFAEAAYGLGMVKTIHFTLGENAMKENQNAFAGILQALWAKQDLLPDRQAFVETLDKLTGFNIPDSGEILKYIVIYMAIFLGCLALGILCKCPGSAWAMSVILAGAMVYYVLNQASRSFSMRKSVLAEITASLPAPFPVSETYASCFSIEEQDIHASKSGYDILFSPVPRSPKINTFFMTSAIDDMYNYDQMGNQIADEKEEVRIVSPIEITRDPDGNGLIPRLNFAPRTSKQFMASFSPRKAERIPVPEAEPELVLSKDGMTLQPYTLPEEFRKIPPESAWLVMPGGVRDVNMTNGVCTLANGGGILVDPAARSMMDSLCTGLRKQQPYLALVSEVRENAVHLASPIEPQGKHVTMIPVRVTVADREISLPGEMLVLAPHGSASRTHFRGNKLQAGVPIHVGQVLNPKISLPGFLTGIFEPVSVSVDVDAVISGGAELKVSLNTPDTAEELLLQRDGSVYTAEGELGKMLTADGSALPVAFQVPPMSDYTHLSAEQAMRSSQWHLRSINITMKGVLNADIQLPAKF